MITARAKTTSRSESKVCISHASGATGECTKTSTYAEGLLGLEPGLSARRKKSPDGLVCTCPGFRRRLTRVVTQKHGSLMRFLQYRKHSLLRFCGTDFSPASR